MAANGNKDHHHVAYVPIYSFLSRSYIKSFICIMALVYISVMTANMVAAGSMTKAVLDLKTERLSGLAKRHASVDDSTIDTIMNNVCYSIDCLYYYNKSTGVWRQAKGSIVSNESVEDLLNNDSSLIYDRYTKLETDRSMYVVSEIYYILDIYQSARHTIVYLSPLVLIFYIGYVFNSERNRIYEMATRKYHMESKLQRNLSESLYHEMVQPLALIRDIVHDVHENLMPHIVESTTRCSGCGNVSPELTNSINSINELGDYKDVMYDAIERIQATLDQVAAVKRIKYSNGTVNIFKIINNSILSTNTTSVNKLTPEYSNLDILNNWSVGGTLNNGDMLNILNIMHNNALEAGASKIMYSAKLNLPLLHIYLTDNGKGIRTPEGEIAKDLDIFNYGISTKDVKNKTKDNINKILNKAGVAVKTNKTVRGAGLSINKELLQSVNGDILVNSTSENGTTFEIIIPVKKTEHHT